MIRIVYWVCIYKMSDNKIVIIRKIGMIKQRKLNLKRNVATKKIIVKKLQRALCAVAQGPVS